MKTLIIMRHGQARARNWNENDYDRSLTPGGRENVIGMGKFIEMREGKPDSILTSSAWRTIETSQLVAASLNFPLEKIVDSEHFYIASARTIFNGLKNLDKQTEFCLFIGHNPGLTDLINLFGVRLDNLPTGSAVCFHFPIESWQEISTEKAQFEWVKLACDLA